MFEDIEYRLRQAFGSFEYNIPDNDLKNYVLLDLKNLFNKSGSSLRQHKLPIPTEGSLHSIMID